MSQGELFEEWKPGPPPKFGTPEWDDAYRRYIGSPQWRKKREAVLKRAGGCCESCNEFKPRLDVHHKTYENFGDEPLTDLQAVCPHCHEVADKDRKAEQQRKNEQAREDAHDAARREGYLKATYGEDWQDRYSVEGEAMEAEAEQWMEEKDAEEEYY